VQIAAVKGRINISIMVSKTQRGLFFGFSTVEAAKSQNLMDIDLIKQDLLNHFNTKKNERVMMPGWGCGIWDYLFEPINHVKENIIYEAQQVIDADPRVELENIDIIEKDHGLRIDMTLLYVPLRAVSMFSIEFDRRNSAMY
jgi:phage baseplate assembly protein W